MANQRKASREVWSFFTGAMGLDLGLEQAGIHPNLAVEINATVCETARKNRPQLDVWETDIRTLDAHALRRRRNTSRDVFLMVGGPPCQSFSPGGKRSGLSDPRGNLIYTYLKLIDEVRPQCFVLENVANIVTAALRHRPISQRPGKHWNLSVYDKQHTNDDNSAQPMEPDELSGTAIRQIVSDISGLGYTLSLAIVNAAQYGAPQHRLRFIMFGVREGCPPTLPRPSHGPESLGGNELLTVRDAVFDLRKRPGPHSVYTPEVAKYFELIPPGGNWRDLPEHMQREALGDASYEAGGGKTGFYRRLAWDAPAPTITGRANRKGSATCHPECTRPLSVKECARLQGFPDDWYFAGSMSNQYMQVGNAVPVQLGEAIGQALRSYIRGGRRRRPKSPDIELMLTEAVGTLRASARNKRTKNTNQIDLFNTASTRLQESRT